jgi:hypothetical protein
VGAVTAALAAAESLANTGDPANDAVLGRVERREQAAMYARHLANEKAVRARRDALAAAAAGNDAELHGALGRLARNAYAAGGHGRTVGRCTAQLAAALNPGRDDAMPFDRAIGDATEAIVVARLAAKHRGEKLPATFTILTPVLAPAPEARTGVPRRDLRNGTLTLAEIVATRPSGLCTTALFAIVLDLPGVGNRRLRLLNENALAAGINLAQTLGDATEETLRWLVEQITGQQDAAVGLAPSAAEWRDVALSLDTLVREHERDQAPPAGDDQSADARLHRDRQRIMDRAPAHDEYAAAGARQAA